MPTPWTPITRPTNTPWTFARLGGAYLTNTLGEFITTMAWEKIIVIVPWGELSITSWNWRTSPTTAWTPRPTI